MKWLGGQTYQHCLKRGLKMAKAIDLTDYVAGIKQPHRKTDCVFLIRECLAPPNGALLKDAKACIGCNRYTPVDRSDEILEHLWVGDSFEEVST